MESSDSDNEEDRVPVQHRGQIDRLAQVDDYYRFVGDLTEEDYMLLRDNDFLGPLGESTKKELLGRLRLMKEDLRQNSDENTDRDHASDDASSDDSLLAWLTTFGQTENVTSEQKENQSCREESQISANSDELRCGLERNHDRDDEHSNPENEYVASAKLPRREDMEDSQRQVENPQSESLFTRPSTSKQDTTETLMEVPPTRSQRRLRSRSPVYRRTRARTDSWSPPHSMWEFLESINGDILSQTFKQPLASENERFSRPEHEETLRQQRPGHELQNRGLIETSKTRNAIHGECYSDATCSSGSWEVRETNPTTPFNLEVGRVHCPACSQRDCRFSRTQRDSRISKTQLTSDSPNNTTTSESEQEELKPMFSHADEASESAYVNTIRNPIHRILNITSVQTHTLSWQTMTGFSNSSNLMDSDSILEHSVSPPRENMERAESPNERHGPNGSARRPGSTSNARYDPDSSVVLISDSSSYYTSGTTSSPILISSSSDEDSETSSLICEDSEERSLPTGLSETMQEGGRMNPIIIDDDDSWPFLNPDEFHLLNENDPYQPAGLTEPQIDNLPLRSVGENDAPEVCSICITEYTAGNMLCVLSCAHEYHDQCIDQWLVEKPTCPICRGPVVDHFEADHSM